ncbi:hypothetical protein [Sphingopyxis granuli]|uniref:hypothetical protein n=1 Tax=Sphingopyxis granuli TaxID=267128 RepID=UPI0012E8AFF1|nr:hypothetical protein [Sphingopyxis granuli]
MVGARQDIFMISANIGALAGELDINRMVVGGTKRIFKFVMRCAMQIGAVSI